MVLAVWGGLTHPIYQPTAHPEVLPTVRIWLRELFQNETGQIQSAPFPKASSTETPSLSVEGEQHASTEWINAHASGAQLLSNLGDPHTQVIPGSANESAQAQHRQLGNASSQPLVGEDTNQHVVQEATSAVGQQTKTDSDSDSDPPRPAINVQKRRERIKAAAERCAAEERAAERLPGDHDEFLSVGSAVSTEPMRNNVEYDTDTFIESDEEDRMIRQRGDLNYRASTRARKAKAGISTDQRAGKAVSASVVAVAEKNGSAGKTRRVARNHSEELHSDTINSSDKTGTVFQTVLNRTVNEPSAEIQSDGMNANVDCFVSLVGGAVRAYTTNTSCSLLVALRR